MFTIRDSIKEHRLQAVLGVDGGFVADSAEAIAAGARYDGDVWEMGDLYLKEIIIEILEKA